MGNVVIVVAGSVSAVWMRCRGPIGIGSVCTFRRARDTVVAWVVAWSRRPRVASIVCSGIYRRIVRHGRIARLDYSGAMERGRFRGGRYLGLTVIHRCQLSAVAARQLFMLSLHRCWSDVALAQGRFLSSIGARVDSAVAAVIADAVHGDIVHHGFVIDIVYVGYVHTVDVLVVIKIATAPVSALVAVACITETIVDAAVETYLRAPISNVPHVSGTTPSPVARCPQKADLGSEYPRSRHPEIAFIAIRPIARSPNVAGTRAIGLLVHRQGRRCDPYRDEDPGK